jgi:2-aminoadipate transaminase
MRLAFCYPTPDFIREGIRRLSAVINGERELLNTFSQTAPLQTITTPHNLIIPPANLG